jgi:DNA-binding transcriptional MerR regulator
VTDESFGKYRIGTVARRTGLSVDVLRAWEKRYGLLEPERGPGRQRLYTDEDLAVLRAVAQQLAEGRAIGEIALAGREALLDERTEPGPSDPSARETLDLARRGIVDAAIALDGDRIRELLDDAFSTVPPETVLARVIEPAARDIGDAWAEGVCSVSGEHLASALFTQRLEVMIHARSGADAPDRARVICACLPDELHEVPALIVTYHLTRMGLRVTYLGASLPFEDLEATVRTLRPQGVYLSVSRRALLDAHKPRLLEVLDRQGPDVAFVIGGRGVTDRDEDLAGAGAILWPDARPARELGQQLGLPRRDKPR